MNNGPGFIVNLILNAQNFANQLKTTLTNAGNSIQQFASQTQRALNNALGNTQTQQQLSAMLDRNIQEYNELKNSVFGFATAARTARVAWEEHIELARQFESLTDLNKKQAQEFGQAMIRSGQASVVAVQQFLLETGKGTLSVKQLKDAISELAKSTGADLKQVANSMGEVTGATGGGMHGGGPSNRSQLGFLSSVSLATLVSRAVWSSVRALTDAYNNATKATIDFAQAEYSLAVQTEAARKVFGNQAPSLVQYHQLIQQLREQTKIYSEQDLTKAVTQVAVLTRALGLNAAQQREIIEIGTALAQTTGVDLSQAVEDTVRALGGSSVVLDKYGLFIRDADKDITAMSMGLGSNAKSLNSQQLALVSLNTILKQTGPLYASLGDYASTVPGQLKEVDAAIQDNLKNLGGFGGELQLYFKNLYNDFLDFLVKSTGSFGKAIEDAINKFNEGKRNARSAGLQSPQDFGLKLNEGVANLGVTRGQALARGKSMGLGEGIPFYLREELKGNQAAIDAFIAEQDAMVDRIQTARNQAIRDLNAQRWQGLGMSMQGPSNGPVDEADVATVKKYGEQIIEAYDAYQKELKDREDKRNADMVQAADDLNSQLQETAAKLQQDLADLDLETARKREDAQTKYSRDLAQLEEDEGTEIGTAKKKTQDEITKATEDYYRKLKELDRQYYFDVRDAAADNDAVALKQLERKYNLDRAKLQDTLDQKIKDANSGEADEIEAIKQKTAQRKAELDARYKQELEDINKYYDRKRQDLDIDLKRERDKIFQHYYDVTQKIQAEYDMQQTIIDQHLRDRYEIIAKSLADEETLTGTTLKAIFDKYDEFLGPGGGIRQILEDFAVWKAKMGGVAGIDIGGGGVGMPEGAVGVSANIGGRLYTVSVQSDGTLTSQQIDTILGELGAVFKDIILQNGGSGGTGYRK